MFCLAFAFSATAARADCLRHVYNNSNFTLRISGSAIGNTDQTSPSCAGQSTVNYLEFCVGPRGTVETRSNDQIAGSGVLSSVILPTGSITYGTNPKPGMGMAAAGCWHWSHVGATGNLVLNDPADFDVATCEHLCHLFAAGVTDTADVRCVRRWRDSNQDPSTASQLTQTGESACIARAISTREDGFDIAFNVGRFGDDRLTTWPTGVGMAPPQIICVRAPPNFERIDATTAIYRYRGSDGTSYALRVSVAADRTSLHFQFIGRPSENDDWGPAFGPLAFGVVMAVGLPAGEVYNRLGGTLYVQTSPTGGDIGAALYGTIPPMSDGRELDGGDGAGGTFCKT